MRKMIIVLSCLLLLPLLAVAEPVGLPFVKSGDS